ncbi:hypothetical protein ABZY30_09560 [Streptomyces massasporeus]|uniref:hypothetical protein n=1 Tax=Streptomyces massasporeus TaxID=67324 RepID=UPI0033B5C804
MRAGTGTEEDDSGLARFAREMASMARDLTPSRRPAAGRARGRGVLAFDVPRRYSQEKNIKLREVARRVREEVRLT